VFGGTITARGGARGGDGGFAEVSGKARLYFDGMVDLRAASGLTGTLLLDPSDITISNGGDSNIDVTGDTISGTANSSNISVATLLALLTSSNVIIDATGGPGSGGGTITILDPINNSSFTNLTFRALGNIAVNADLTTFTNLTFISSGGALTQTAPITANAVTFAMGGPVELTNPGNQISSISGTSGGAINIVSARTLAVTSDGLTAGPFSSVTLTTLGSFSNIFINGTITGFGITLNPGGSVFGGTPGFSDLPPVIIDYQQFINDTSIGYVPPTTILDNGVPQLTKAADVDVSVLSACQMVSTECAGATYDQSVPLDDNDLAPVNLGNEELIFTNDPRRRKPAD